MVENIPRVLSKNVTAIVDLPSIKPKMIFSWIKNSGVDDSEMLKTFNCGVGFVIFTKEKNILKIKKIFKSPYLPYVIGCISKKSSVKIKFNGKIKF